MAPAIRSQSRIVIISIIIIIAAIAVSFKHGTYITIRGHISKRSHNCEALIHDVFVRQVSSLLIMASLRQEIFKLKQELCYDFKYFATTLINTRIWEQS